MIHALAVFWIQVPSAETVLASHSQKNARLANGAQAECIAAGSGPAAALSFVLRRHFVVLPRRFRMVVQSPMHPIDSAG